jgi:3D (Asp-Asp-Asp) domain-containing protein
MVSETHASASAAARLKVLASSCWLAACLSGCGGSAWMSEPFPDSDEENFEPGALPPQPTARASASKPLRARPASDQKSDAAGDEGPRPKVVAHRRLQGKVLGKFRNTYYDFPAEQDHEGPPVALMNPSCHTIKNVPRGFYEAVCVQGSGTLDGGSTVSFAKRDCECAEICPRTKQRICFDELDRVRFPWGRGATGGPITPLLTVAVDSQVIPLGTPIYIPEYDGIPRDVDRTSVHDGCFVAQDRGLRIKGKQVDIFTGHESITRLWNTLVPSNQGVTVVLDNPRCARARLPEVTP